RTRAASFFAVADAAISSSNCCRPPTHDRRDGCAPTASKGTTRAANAEGSASDTIESPSLGPRLAAGLLVLPMLESALIGSLRGPTPAEVISATGFRIIATQQRILNQIRISQRRCCILRVAAWLRTLRRFARLDCLFEARHGLSPVSQPPSSPPT